MQTRLVALAIVATLGAAAAQATLVAPIGFDIAEGNSNNAFPWNWPNSPIRTQFIYDSSNFTGQNVNNPVTITRLRFRADASGGTWSGGTYSSAVIQLSTCPVDCLSLSTTFAANHGPDLTTVVNGPLTVQAGNAPTPGPGPWHIDIPLATPFVYTPANGDLTVDITVSGFSGGSLTQADHQGPGGPLCSRLYDLSGTSPTGSFDLNYGAICEFTYAGSTGYATQSPYGTGCPARTSTAVYEQFSSAGFDLANTSLMFVPGLSGSYTILPGPNSWFAGFTNNLNLGDDQCGSVTMPFSFPHSGGTTATISVSSNGFLWLGSNTNSACCTGMSSTFLSEPMARIAALWMDLYPPGGGGVYADYNALANEYVVTWNNVPEYTTSPPVNMQIAMQPSGIFEIRYQTLTNTTHQALTGYSMGSVVNDPGNSDLSSVVTGPITTSGVSIPLSLAAGSRPVLGTTVNLLTSDIAAGTLFGVNAIGLAQFNPGIDLTSIGAPGCSQYLNPAASVLYFVSGPTSSMPLTVPNNAGLAGLHVYTQSIAFSSGINPLGVAFSNGVSLGLNIN